MNDYFKSGAVPSVCQWELTFKFRTREQCKQFLISYLDKSDIPLQFSYQEDLSVHPPEFTVTIEQGYWAHNLTAVAQLLEEADYKDCE